MKDLFKRIARVLSSGLTETAVGDALLTGGSGIRSRFDAVWDEALMASMSDENAHRILDYWGPRLR